MSLYSMLLAQAESTPFKLLYLVGFILVTLVIPFALGKFFSRRLRMDNYGWKIGLILASVALALVIVGRTWNVEEGKFDLKLGVDLKGGVILIYEVDDTAPLPGQGDGGSDGSADFDMPALVEALSRRINPSGTKEIVIRPVGDRQVEIIIPEVDQTEVERIKSEITTAGVLEFRIVANTSDHQDVIELARQMAGQADPLRKRSRTVRDSQSETVGVWARVARQQGEQGEEEVIRPFKLDVSQATLRNSSTGDLIVVPANLRGSEPDQFADYIASQEIAEIDVLMATNDGYDVNGGHLGSVSMGSDEVLRPAIFFNLKGEGIDRFAGLTREYSPSGSVERRLGIMLDNALLSAPNIREMIQGRGQITGRFTEEEVSFLVNILRAGSLPVVLNKNPISENLIDPLLGEATVRQGRFAIIISIALVLVFIFVYYRFAGFVACLALLANLLFIIALMISIQAALTLPGLAGLVLTVGMSVDANVLIFERIREELKRGAALRMAIRNGYSKATTTIVDANVTTLITAVVLYMIGTDQIRGFAVTLILGILMSMYTAIFCSRVVFDVAERTRRLSKLTMTQVLGATQIDFIGKRGLAAIASLLLIAVGIAGLAARGADIFDIDFRGGTSVHMMFAEAVDTNSVRATLEEELERFTVTAMNNTGGGSLNNTFKVDSSLPEVTELQQVIQAAFQDSGMQLQTYTVSYGTLKRVSVGQPADSATSAITVPAAPVAAFGSRPAQILAQIDDDAAPPADPAEADRAAADPDPAEASTASAGTLFEVELEFGHEINADTLRAEIEAAGETLATPIADFELNNPSWDGESSNAYSTWTLMIPAEEAQATELLATLERKFSTTPVWPSSNKIGGQVAGQMQNRAIAALVTSLFGIVVYIWIRFQRVIFGLAAVVALIHDVLLTLGAIAVSAWLAGGLGFLLIEEFKISLPIVAALLTIIGYSLNDTIVVFDRIREVKGKSPDLTSEMINTSINQTLSRTLLTSLTTLIVVVILYAIGGQGIHGFAFSLVVGVIVGTYSSIFVASPALLWMSGSKTRASGKSVAA